MADRISVGMKEIEEKVGGGGRNRRKRFKSTAENFDFNGIYTY